MQKICQLNKLFQRHSFRADLRGKLQRFKYRRQFVSRPIQFQEFQHHLASLRKTQFNHPHKHGMQPGGEQRLFTADQDNARGIHVGHREKTIGGNFEIPLWFITQLQ